MTRCVLRKMSSSFYTLMVTYTISICILITYSLFEGWTTARILAVISALLVGMIPRLYRRTIRTMQVLQSDIDVLALVHVITGDAALISLGVAHGEHEFNSWLLAAGVCMIIATGASHVAFVKWDKDAPFIQMRRANNVSFLSTLIFVSSSLVASAGTSINYAVFVFVQLMAVNAHLLGESKIRDKDGM